MPAPFPRPLAPLLALATVLLAAAAPAWAGNAHGFDDDFEYAVVDRQDGQRNSTFSSSTHDWEEISDLLESEKGPVFWFSLAGRSYLVRDPATVAEAKRIVQPMHELGKKQGQLGARQGALGARQGRYGAEQGRLGARQGVLGARLAALALRSSREGREGAAVRAERRRIEDEMNELSREIEELGRRHEPLGDEQSILGKQQAELGKRQASASKKAGAELRRLAADARDDGRAQRVD